MKKLKISHLWNLSTSKKPTIQYVLVLINRLHICLLSCCKSKCWTPKVITGCYIITLHSVFDKNNEVGYSPSLLMLWTLAITLYPTGRLLTTNHYVSLQHYTPEPPETDNTSETPTLQFTYVECLLFSFHETVKLVSIHEQSTAICCIYFTCGYCLVPWIPCWRWCHR